MADQYKEITEYFETLIPCAETRDYVLRFLAKRIKTQKYSPVALLFCGVPGAGKTLFTNMLKRATGDQCGVVNIDTDMLIDDFKDYLLKNRFVVIDHASSLSEAHQRRLHNAYMRITRAPEIHICSKYKEPITGPAPTLIFVSNMPMFRLQEHDRRAVVINTPNTLKGNYESLLSDESIEMFCNYLDTLPEMSDDEYHQPPMTADKLLAKVA